MLVFYSYLKKDTLVIEHVLRNTQKIYRSYAPADLERDSQFINRLYVSSPKPIELPGAGTQENRNAVREQLDDVEKVVVVNQAGEKLPYADELDDLIKLNIAFKTIHILGQVLRNFPGSLKREIEVRIADECYLVGLRMLGFVFASVERNADDLRRYYSLLILHRQPWLSATKVGQNAEEAMIGLVEFWGNCSGPWFLGRSTILVDSAGQFLRNSLT